ncbi:MAG: tetratricopeptide repeat protein [Rhodospirillaceae bacterium]
MIIVVITEASVAYLGLTQIARLSTLGGFIGPEPKFALAVSHFQDGDLPEAERLLLEVAAETGGNADVYGRLAVIGLNTGRKDQALQWLAQSVSLAGADIDPLLLKSEIMAALEDPATAIAACEDAAAIQPRDPRPWMRIAAIHRHNDRRYDAMVAWRKALEIDPNHPSAHANMGVMLKHRGDVVGAEDHFVRALALRPNDAGVRLRLADLMAEGGRYADAAGEYRRVLEIKPDNIQALVNLGYALLETRDYEDALAAGKRAGALDPALDHAHHLIGRARYYLDDGEKAVVSLKRSIDINPGFVMAHASLAKQFLAMGRAEDCLAAAEQCLDLDPANTTALAYKAVALTEAGRRAEAEAILDFDTFVRTTVFTDAPGFGDMDAFNQALAEHVAGHETMVANPSNKSTIGGGQTLELLDGDPGPVAVLADMITGSVEQYMAEVAQAAPDHPHVKALPEEWGLISWGVVLGDEGFHHMHIHDSGWLSSVYYIRVPPSIARQPNSDAGWLEFGPPPPTFPTKAQHPSLRLQPEEGKLVLFPSSFYHGTLPFRDAAPRITVSFDIVPK